MRCGKSCSVEGSVSHSCNSINYFAKTGGTESPVTAFRSRWGRHRGVDLVSEAEQYRLKAAECAEAAEQVSNVQERQSLLVLARVWLMLANRAVQGSLQRMRGQGDRIARQ
jgi:hypothetical protein